jgi:predicted DNA-binding transcriptional regulator AlpA
MIEPDVKDTEMSIPDGDRLLKLNQVIARMGVGKTSIYARVEAGSFPQASSAWP